MSGGALMSQLHLNSSACCLNSLPLNLKHRIFPQFLHLTNHTEKFTLSTKKSPRNCRRTVCFAVEDLKENDQFSGSVGISSPFEDTQDELVNVDQERRQSGLYDFLYPSKDDLPDDTEMTIFDHLEELRQRIFVSVLAVGAAILGCFAFSKDLIVLLEAPVKEQGVRFLQLAPGEFFFTTLKVSGYCGLLLGSPVILYEIIAFVVPGLTRAERRFLGPIVLGSSVLFYAGITFSYLVLTPAALNFFVTYAEGVVESLWSIDQYFEFVLILMFSTGLSFQVPVIQLLLGQTGLVSGDQMLSIWRYVVVGAVVAAAVLTPSTDPLTQLLLAGPLLGLYLGGAWVVKFIGR
ncbi:sec-independent protein translocase protein TATC, chloroplastic [Beta vulgaris subsp. vulgaris]|uniref:sec-independent protein translocase protein TATC, chloroplastic n=1 Tax=Beta vulgaris subsp. vulgaris TaxID=3555 RepID=UPI0020373BBF|nr:sec-independent protein translocase protein TATC, chloroplastic [Beta vulgaris subsp. vulgaris]